MKILFATLVLLLAGCSATQSENSTSTTFTYSDTMDIIRSAAESAPHAVEGEYILYIKATGSQGAFVYLNTELDYRDQRSVTVAIHPRAVKAIIDKYGSAPQDYFLDKSIAVSGQAKRIKINFNSQGKPTGKYYYQTHIRIKDVSQIQVLSQSV